MVVAAHPDDEVLGCGATIAKHVSSGDRVWVLVLGEGITSRQSLSSREKKELVVELHRDARKASKILGVEKLILKHSPDNQFDSIPRLQIIHQIEEVVEQFKPDMIYTHHHGDVNIDHRRTVEAVEVAARPARDTSMNEIFSFENPSSTEWNFAKPKAFRPNVFVALNKTFLKKKVSAMEAYASEMRTFPHPRSPEYLEALAAVRGGQVGFERAEAFELLYWRRT